MWSLSGQTTLCKSYYTKRGFGGAQMPLRRAFATESCHHILVNGMLLIGKYNKHVVSTYQSYCGLSNWIKFIMTYIYTNSSKQGPASWLSRKRGKNDKERAAISTTSPHWLRCLAQLLVTATGQGRSERQSPKRRWPSRYRNCRVRKRNRNRGGDSAWRLVNMRSLFLYWQFGDDSRWNLEFWTVSL